MFFSIPGWEVVSQVYQTISKILIQKNFHRAWMFILGCSFYCEVNNWQHKYIVFLNKHIFTYAWVRSGYMMGKAAAGTHKDLAECPRGKSRKTWTFVESRLKKSFSVKNIAHWKPWKWTGVNGNVVYKILCWCCPESRLQQSSKGALWRCFSFCMFRSIVLEVTFSASKQKSFQGT